MRTIQFIIAPRRTPDRQNWINTVRQEAGRAKAIVLVDRPEPTDPPARQVEMIRKAITRDVDALLVEPMDDPEVLQALGEVHAKGIPLVVIGPKRPIESPQEGKPAPLVFVDFAPFEPSVQELVGAIQRDARGSGIPGTSHVLIAVNTEYGPENDDEIAALTSALRAAGFGSVETVPFSEDYVKGSDALLAQLKADPKVQVLVAMEDKGISAIMDAYAKFKDQRAMSLAGIMTIEKAQGPGVFKQCAAVVDRNGITLSRQAIQLALRMARGGTLETYPPELVIPMPIYGTAVDDLPEVKASEVAPNLVRPGR
ncbi:MAG: substrate-binding domain-containing protein [Isosphaeraceae bacterium]